MRQWRYFSIFAVICLPFLLLKLLSAAFLFGSTPDYPWVLSPVAQQEVVRSTVYANLVAWMDYEGLSPELPIMIKDLETGEIRALREELPCPGHSGSRMDIDGDWIVAVFFCGPFDYEVQAFNLATDELVLIQPPPDAPPEQVWGLEPAIHNEKVVWYQRTSGENADLYLYDLQTRTAISLTANGGPVVEIHPDIYGDWVVWDSYNLDTFDHNLVAYNLVSSEHITHPVSTYPFHPFPRIYENLVVWGDHRQGTDNGDIYGYDLDTRQEFAIITEPDSQYAPVIDQNLIAYLQITDNDYVVHVHNLISGETAFIFQTDNTNNLSEIYDLTVHDGLIGFYESYVGPDIIYVARQLPERFYMPVFMNGN